MVQGIYTIPTIQASEGFKLTQAQEVEPKDRFFANKILLGEGDDAENYTEWAVADVERFKAEHPELKHIMGLED